MINTLVLFAHPNKKKSIRNKQIIEGLEKFENIEIRDLYTFYPDFEIDVKREQISLKKADLIIFQFPLYWYSSPSLLKKWQDEVLTYDFAHGKKFELEKKYFLISFTIGGSLENYKKKNKGRYNFYEFLVPLKNTFTYCKMIYQGYLLSDLNLATFSSFKKKNTLSKSDHVEQIKGVINLLSKAKA